MPGWIVQNEHNHSSLQDEVRVHVKVWIEISILIFYEHGWWQPFRIEFTCRILHRCHLSKPLTVSVQGNCSSMHSNNSNGDRDMLQSILQTQSVLWWTGNHEGDLLGAWLQHLYASLWGCRNSWVTDLCLPSVWSWWVVHRILVSWSHFWESTCHQFSYNLNPPMVELYC